jgi:hypothetical protein
MDNITVTCGDFDSGISIVGVELINSDQLDCLSNDEISVPEHVINEFKPLPKRKRGKLNHINQDQAWMRRLKRRGRNK